MKGVFEAHRVLWRIRPNVVSVRAVCLGPCDSRGVVIEDTSGLT